MQLPCSAATLPAADAHGSKLRSWRNSLTELSRQRRRSRRCSSSRLSSSSSRRPAYAALNFSSSS